MDTVSTPQTSSDLQSLLTQVENDLVDHIIKNIREERLSLEESKKLAHDFLALLPAADKDDLLKKLNGLGDTYDEAREVYITFAAPHAEEDRLKKIEQMTAHIKAGNIEHAIAVAKGGVLNA